MDKGGKKERGRKKRKLEKGVRRQQERGDGKKERRYNSRSNRRGGAVMEGEHGRGAPRLACAWGPATWGSGPVFMRGRGREKWKAEFKIRLNL